MSEARAKTKTLKSRKNPKDAERIAVLHQEKRRHIASREILGRTVFGGYPLHTLRDKEGSPGRCPRDLLLLALRSCGAGGGPKKP